MHRESSEMSETSERKETAVCDLCVLERWSRVRGNCLQMRKARELSKECICGSSVRERDLLETGERGDVVEKRRGKERGSNRMISSF